MVSKFLVGTIRAGMVIVGQWFIAGVMKGFGISLVGMGFLPALTIAFVGAAFGLFLGDWIIERSFKEK